MADVEKMTPDDLLDMIGVEISPARLKCALLSLDTLRKGVGDRVAWPILAEPQDVPA